MLAPWAQSWVSQGSFGAMAPRPLDESTLCFDRTEGITFQKVSLLFVYWFYCHHNESPLCENAIIFVVGVEENRCKPVSSEGVKQFQKVFTKILCYDGSKTLPQAVC
jgi:hypothetical protein